LWHNLVSSKGTVQVYRSALCSKIVGVSTVSFIQPRISFEGTWWNRVGLPHTKLSVLHKRKEFHQVSRASNLHQIITSRGLPNSLSELCCLLKIIQQLWQQQSRRDAFPTMKRIKTFLRSTMSEERLSAPAVLSVGKNLLESSNFNEKVTEAFVLRKDRRMDFAYK
jgi:hypothetical protein